MKISPNSVWLMENIVCPRDRTVLTDMGSSLVCENGHDYPVVDGIPVMLLPEAAQTIGIADGSIAAARRYVNGIRDDAPLFTSTLGINEDEKRGILDAADRAHSSIDPVVKFMVGATNGILYRDLIGTIEEYPIPEIRLPRGRGERFLDIGCNWGRWSLAAARAGYRPVGIDPSLGAVLSAKRVACQLGLVSEFIVADARFLPFRDECFDLVFSYSVLQHFSKENARVCIGEIQRVLKQGGQSLVQMPNVFGVRCLFHQVRRGFRRPIHFEVRYWTPFELRRVFSRALGRAQLSVDCFFGIGLQATDAHLMPLGRRIVIWASESLRRISKRISWLVYIADSIYVISLKQGSANGENVRRPK